MMIELKHTLSTTTLYYLPKNATRMLAEDCAALTIFRYVTKNYETRKKL